MKKLNLLFLLLLFISQIFAQTTPVSNYVFIQDDDGIYTEINGGEVHGTSANDDESFNAIEIGFTFNYNGNDYSQISIQSNGFIAMGSSVNEIIDEPISDAEGSNNVISGFGGRLRSKTDGELMTVMEGTAPARVLTIQWKNYMRDLDDCDEDIINFQIKLYETSNKIEFVYGAFSISNNNGYHFLMPQIGLRGNSNSDFNNRKTYFEDIKYKWENSIDGTSNGVKFGFTRGIIPQSGLTFAYEAPANIDAGIVDLTNPERVMYSAGNQDIIVSLKNFGTETLTSATIKWNINGGTINTFQWNGSLTQGNTEENINIGNFDFTDGNFYDIEIYTETPNNIIDENPENDNFYSYHTVNLYCSSNIVYDEWWYIEDIIIGNIVHVYCGSYDNYSIGDYSTHFNAEYTPGSNINYTINANSGGYIAFWIDYNDDNNYDETEWLGTSDYFAYNETANGVITIAEDAPEGNHKLRVRYIYSVEPVANNACTPLSELGYEGDAHEYAINIYNASSPPPCVFNQSPEHNETNVATNKLLTWESEAATDFDVYFGTTASPPFIGEQTENIYNPSLLDINTTYFWKVIARNENGTATDCETLTFTTGELPEYCIPGYSDCYEWDDAIDNFYMENLIHENSGCSEGGYGDFTESGITTELIQGADVAWSADYGSQDCLAIWIDFNDDGVFNETDEFVYHTELEDGNFVHIENDNFILPDDCMLGTHRMRVRCAFDFNEFEGTQACASAGSGETHDYVVIIVTPSEPPQCADNPNPGMGTTGQYLNTELTWMANQATSYDVYFGTTTLEYVGEVNEAIYNPGTLEQNTEYQWKVEPKNSAGQPDDCDVWTFTTGEELEYCTDYLYYGDSYSDPCEWGEFIDDFSIGDLNHLNTGCDGGGYNVNDYTNMSVELARGANYTWNAEVQNGNDYFAIWFDTNNDGTFDETECLYTAQEELPVNCSGNITIPAEASLGEHRLRLRMVGNLGMPIEPWQACYQFQYGEAHDYTVIVTEITNAPDCADTPFPANNAVDQYLNIDLTWSANDASVYDVYFGTDELLYQGEFETTEFSPETLEPNTNYQWQIIPKNNAGQADDCDVWMFTTGEELEYCTDYLYYGDTYSTPCEWGEFIDDFSIGDLNHLNTGCDGGGYNVNNYTYMSVELARGVNHTWNAEVQNGNDYFAIWFDTNNDGTFDETECLYTAQEELPVNCSGNITIPAETSLGEHRLRLRMVGNLGIPIEPWQACHEFQYGEAHDYTVIVTEISNAPDCADTPFPANNAVDQYLNIDLTWSANDASVYDVYFGTDELLYQGEFETTEFSPETLEPNTNYQWQIIPKNNAGQPDDCEVWNFTTGTEDNVVNIEHGIKIYPNPADKFLNIETDEKIDIIKITNSIGQQIIEKQCNNNFIKINTETLKSGIYFIKIKTGNKIFTKKIILIDN